MLFAPFRGVASEARLGCAPRLIPLSDYPNPEPGSFVPMIAPLGNSWTSSISPNRFDSKRSPTMCRRSWPQVTCSWQPQRWRAGRRLPFSRRCRAGWQWSRATSPSDRYVAERVPGISIVKRDPDDMAAEILSAAERDEAPNAAGHRPAHEAVQRHFSFDHWCSSLFEIYDEIAARTFPSQLRSP